MVTAPPAQPARPAQVSLPDACTVEVVRAFRAPPSLVYRAYTVPELLQRWLLGPPGWTMPVCEMDVRVGGAFRWRWRSDETQEEFGFHGVFEEVEPEARLVHTEIYDPGDVGGEMVESRETRVTVTFTPDGEHTTLTTRVEYASREARDAALSTGMTDGMETSYARLDELLA